MGFFSDKLAPGLALNRVAKTCEECVLAIRAYNRSSDSSELLKAAWLYAYGVGGAISKWGFNPYTTKIALQFNGELKRLTIDEFSGWFASRLSVYGASEGVMSSIQDVLDGGVLFNKYSYLVSSDLKSKLKP